MPCTLIHFQSDALHSFTPPATEFVPQIVTRVLADLSVNFHRGGPTFIELGVGWEDVSFRPLFYTGLGIHASYIVMSRLIKCWFSFNY